MNYLDEVRQLMGCNELSDVQALKIALDARVYLFHINLQGANLEGANLEGFNLRDTDLCKANLRGVSLHSVNLRGVNLQNAIVDGADFYGADLYDAKLDGCIMNWQSHDLISERLRQEAKTPLDYAIATFFLNRRWCLDELIKHGRDIFGDDAVDATLAKMRAWVRNGDNAPDVLTGESA